MLYFNQWWKNGNVNPSLLGKNRSCFNEMAKSLTTRQIVLLFGMRRVGKTTLMFQLIDYLLKKKKVSPFHILYYSFDDEKKSIREIIDIYEREALKKSISDCKVFLFFDEIQKLKGWADQIKIIYDMYPQVKIFLSGSSAFFLKKGVSDSLAGRFFKYEIPPLTFDEFLDFQGISIDKERETLYASELRTWIDRYIQSGGFPETLEFLDDKFLLMKYFKESILDRVILIDIPEEYQVRKRYTLYALLRIIADRPGLYLEYKNIGNDLKIDQRTVEDYFVFLEHSLLVKRIYNFSKNLASIQKKLKRAYITNPAFTLALNPGVDRTILLEQFFVDWTGTQYFWRDTSRREVDIVMAGDMKKGVLPIEIKIKKKIKSDDVKPMGFFFNAFNIDKGLIITDETESEPGSHKDIHNVGEGVVKAIPYWKIWTIEKELAIAPREPVHSI